MSVGDYLGQLTLAVELHLIISHFMFLKLKDREQRLIALEKGRRV